MLLSVSFTMKSNLYFRDDVKGSSRAHSAGIMGTPGLLTNQSLHDCKLLHCAQYAKACFNLFLPYNIRYPFLHSARNCRILLDVLTLAGAPESPSGHVSTYPQRGSRRHRPNTILSKASSARLKTDGQHPTALSRRLDGEAGYGVEMQST